MKPLPTSLAAIVLLAAAGCGTQTAADQQRAADPTGVPSPDGPVQPLGSTRVAEVDGVLTLCLAAGADLDASSCSGPRLEGFDPALLAPDPDLEGDTADLAALAGQQQGPFDLTGTLEDGGDALRVLTATPADMQSYSLSYDSDDLATRCAGRVDPGRATPEPEAAYAFDRLEAVDGLVRTSGYVGSDGSERTVVAHVHGSSDVAVAAVRKIWTGPLCVLDSPLSRAELEDEVRRLGDTLPGALSTSLDDPDRAHLASSASVEVVYDDGTLARRVRDESGGLVDLVPAMGLVSDLGGNQVPGQDVPAS